MSETEILAIRLIKIWLHNLIGGKKIHSSLPPRRFRNLPTGTNFKFKVRKNPCFFLFGIFIAVFMINWLFS